MNQLLAFALIMDDMVMDDMINVHFCIREMHHYGFIEVAYQVI